MNKVLYVARRAKGYSAKQIAKVLQITEMEYTELEHSVSDLSAKQALQLSKLFNVEAEMFLYTDSRDKRLVKYAMEEVTKIVTDVQAEQLPPRYYFHIVTLGNTAITLQAELGHALYMQFELELDNKALRSMNEALKGQLHENV